MAALRKALHFMGSSHSDLKAFPDERAEMPASILTLYSAALSRRIWKTMKTVRTGVKELRVRDPTGAYRVIYLATRPEAVYVLHCFQKKTEKTAQQDIDLAKVRLKAIPKTARS